MTALDVARMAPLTVTRRDKERPGPLRRATPAIFAVLEHELEGDVVVPLDAPRRLARGLYDMREGYAASRDPSSAAYVLNRSEAAPAGTHGEGSARLFELVGDRPRRGFFERRGPLFSRGPSASRRRRRTLCKTASSHRRASGARPAGGCACTGHVDAALDESVGERVGAQNGSIHVRPMYDDA